MKEGSKVPRKGFIAKREVLPDPIYNNVVVTKLINNIMLDGKKGVAQKIVYDAFNIVAEKTGKDALEAFQEAMDNIMPVLEVKARLGLRWLTRYSRERNEKTMKERLANEIVDAINGTGGSVKKREDTHKMAEANKAFAHYRW